MRQSIEVGRDKQQATGVGGIPRGWVVLGAASASWGLVAGVAMGFLALSKAISG